MRDQGAAEEWAEESRQSDDRRFAPLRLEDYGIEFRAREKGEDDSAGPSQKCNPLSVAKQPAMRQKRADDQLGHRAHHNLRERSRDSQPDRQQCRRQRQAHPQSRQSPSVHHEHELLNCRSGNRPGHNSATGFPCQESSSVRPIGWTAVKGELPHRNQLPRFHTLRHRMSRCDLCCPRYDLYAAAAAFGHLLHGRPDATTPTAVDTNLSCLALSVTDCAVSTAH